MPIVTLLLLTCAVSLDGFGVGVMYGIRKIKIPLLSIIIVSLCSGIIILASMHLGVLLLQYLPPIVAKLLGAIILIGIGIWSFIQLRSQKNGEPSAVTITPEEKKEIRFEIKSLGLVIQILRTPSKADVDRSGNISAAEAAFLGLALSLDALGAGIGAALIGLSPLITSLTIAISSGVFIFSGLRMGYLLANVTWINKFSVLPGFILIVMGIMKLF